MLNKLTKNPKKTCHKCHFKTSSEPGEIKFKVNLRNTLITNNYYYFAIATSTTASAITIINKSK